MTIVTWKWVPLAGYRSKFEAEHVNTLLRMVQRNYTKPFDFVCVTDDWRGLDSAIRIVPMWQDLNHIPSPHGGVNPSCYRRLKAFSPEAVEILGPRILSIDLDVVILGNVDNLFDRTEDFVGWEMPVKFRHYSGKYATRFNGSMWLLTTGSRPKVWTEFDPVKSPKLTMSKHLFGSDQAWISYMLQDEAAWTAADGVISYREQVKKNGYKLPEGTKICFFNGHDDPWGPVAQKHCPWINDFYR